ncbi:LamG-like jellyroll fold domain-containing protein [Desertivirga brevis]|uniref:LamG-like jellyroll fold domain-containing protein n=1 Tax=Desertivirga brevis TaxID=2810310 RepID=UPI001A96F906|nr:LamG-like jellyroll fold domain-containing protein [Pedobacter sp. SYSU D00873]
MKQFYTSLKRGTTALFVASSLFIRVQSFAQMPSPLVHYKFNGNTNDEKGGSAAVVSGNSLFVEGVEGQAFRFDGTNYITLPEGIINHPNITIATAVKIEQYQNYSRVFDFGNDTETFFAFYSLIGWTADPGGAFLPGLFMKNSITGGEKGAIPWGQPPYLLGDNKWVYLVCTVDEGGVAKVYVNGSQIAENANEFKAGVRALGITKNNYLGKSQFEWDGLAKQVIDDFRIYDKVLSPAEIQALNATVLPVKLSSYEAKLNANGNVDLRWATVSESGNDYFVIERSTDGETFEKFVSVKSKGEKGGFYSATDASPANGPNYYRLSQVDKNGDTKVEGIRLVSLGLGKEEKLVVYPNPLVNNTLSIQVPPAIKTKDIDIKVSDLTGKIVYKTKIVRGMSGVEVLNLDLSSGLYLLKVNDSFSTKLSKE